MFWLRIFFRWSKISNFIVYIFKVFKCEIGFKEYIIFILCINFGYKYWLVYREFYIKIVDIVK